MSLELLLIIVLLVGFVCFVCGWFWHARYVSHQSDTYTPPITKVVTNSYLRRLSPSEGVPLGATNGSRIIAEATDIFIGWIDPDFRNYRADESGATTKPALADVYEISRDGNLKYLLGFLSSDSKSLALTQDQIIDFVEKNPEYLHPKGGGTFFLFESHKKLFVAFVLRGDSGKLKASVYHFANVNVCFAEHRPRLVVLRTGLIL